MHMKNQTPTQTEPSGDMITPGAWDISETRPGPVRLAPPIKPEPQPVWLNGWKITSKVMEESSKASASQELFSEERGTLSLLNDL